MTSETVAARSSSGAMASKIAIPGDIWGGIAAMLVAIPSSIAYGVVIFTAASPALVGAGAFAGILGAGALGIVAPLVSRNRGFITAPCAPAAAVMSGLAAQLALLPAVASRVIPLLALTALIAAILQVVYGAIRAGKLIKFIPYQVVNGYLSGVAVIIAVAQIPKLLGVPGGTHLRAAVTSPYLWNAPGVIVGIITIATMAIAPRITKVVPGAIIGLTSGIAGYFLMALLRPELLIVQNNPLIVGPIHTGGSFIGLVSARMWSLFGLTWSDLNLVAGPALTLSALLSIDTLKTGVVLDALTRTRHDSNRELIGQGVANAVSFVAGGIPGAGTMGPTLVNVTSGGRTLWSGVLEGAFVVVSFLILRSAIAWIPIAALSGILLVIAWRMFDFHMFRLLILPSTRLDFFVIASVVVVAETIGLIQASAVGIGLAILLFIRNQTRGSVILRKAGLREVHSKRRRNPEERKILDDHGGEGLFVQLKDDLFFGTTDQLFTELDRDLAERRFILFDFRRVQSMDYTAANLFRQMQQRLRDRGGQLLFSGMPSSLSSRQDIQHYMRQLGLIDTEDGGRVFDIRDSALEWMEQKILTSNGWVAGESAPPLELDAIVLLRQLDPQAVLTLRQSMQEISLQPGSKVFSAGGTGDEVFFVRRGRIHILLPLEGGKRHHLATIGRGDFFGEMAFLDQGMRSADAEAASESDLFVLSRRSFDALAAANPQLALCVFEQLSLAIAQRLRATDAELRALEER